MPIYMISATCAAAIIGIIMSVIFCRMKILNFRTAVSITMASLATALVMPGIFSVISSFTNKNNAPELSSPVITTALSLLVYMIFVIVLSMIISFILPKIKIGNKSASQPEAVPEAIADSLPEATLEATPQSEAELSEAFVSAETEAAASDTPVVEDAIVLSNESESPGDNYIENIYLNFIGRNDENIIEIAKNEENKGFEENTDEKSVDSNENIDKMGIENNIHDGEVLTIEECIDEAFRLRDLGDLEGSILYYMYAMDKKPQKSLTFWIVLDICVMYKTLGQQDLALDILDSYYDIYGEEMDNSVREEIESNLTDTQA